MKISNIEKTEVPLVNLPANAISIKATSKASSFSQTSVKLSLDIAKNNFILNVKFRKPMMNNLNISIRISSQGFDRELAPLNFTCGLILLYSSLTAGKPAYLLITLLNSCKKCFVSARSLPKECLR